MILYWTKVYRKKDHFLNATRFTPDNIMEGKVVEFGRMVSNVQ